IFALGTIIPMRPDKVLRKGSGTLCETLLMVQAFMANVIFPNKHEDEQYKYTNDGHLLISETYVGASVEALESGVFRSDIPCRFKIVPETVQYLIDNIDRTLQQSIEIEEKLSMDLIENLSEIKEDILQRLQHLKNVPKRLENPNIYHLDIGAMYPNIILTNRLQPSAIVDSTRCAQCDLNRPNAHCQRKMDWIWRGTYVPATRNELQRIQLQLENERFSFNGQSIQKKIISNNNTVSFHELPQETQLSIERKRLADYCRKAYKKTNAAKKDDLNEAKRCNNLIVIYDSLQLAHKCILNSFYGYVMRKGYFKMCSLASNGMGGIVCTTGSTIIKRTRELIEQIGRPLELDTDGIWCVLPATSPENYELIIRDPSRPKVVISYPCSLLNLIIKDHYTNDQYHEPYLAMILPASKEEGKRIKKRYCVFNMDGTIAELKDFEVKCNGELQLIKIFQASVFEAFLKGTTLEEYYNHVATIADYWLDMLYSHAKDISDKELFELILERRTMSRMLSNYGEQKSTSISTAKRLAEFLGEDVIKDKGLCCRFVIANVPCDAPVTERTIPFQYHVLYKQKRITDVFNSIDKQTHIDNNEQQLILTNDIEDIGQQTESSIKLIKKTTTKTLKRKREDLNDKTTTRQWRIVLGPPPSFGQTTNQHIKWLSYQKRKWEIQHEQRHQPSIISDKIQLSTKQKTSADGKIDTYIRRAAEHLHTRPWQIISYELTGQIGIFKACCLVKHELVQIKIKVPRIFYVNYRTSIENNNNNTHEQLKQTQRSSGYERTINNCSKHVNRNAAKKNDLNEVKRYNNLIVIYDSLQFAYKCILNSFYGYVMRRGARWHRTEMGGIVCTTGSIIIKRTRELVEQIGRPLELDTKINNDIWCVLPAAFPENYELIIRDPSRPKFVISYPCSLLNLIIKDHYTNDQYHELVDKDKHIYEIRSENSIFFKNLWSLFIYDIVSIKRRRKTYKEKRYCIFNMDGTIAELKGTTLEECYNHVATIADYWLDMLYSHVKDISDKELFKLISERRTILAEFLGEDIIKDKGLYCRFVIANVPRDASITEHTILLDIFQ
ncbi:unnamed protein product, partial [Rotaria sp. Silwood2]